MGAAFAVHVALPGSAPHRGERRGMGATPWDAEIAVDAALAQRAIGTAVPPLAAATVEPFGAGWDNAAFLVDGTYVFRFPRRRIAIALLEREVRLLPLIAPHVPLAIPAPAFVGARSDAFPAPFAGYPLIAGRTACDVALDDASRSALAEPLARFLRALHAIEPAPLVAAGLPPDEIGRLDAAKRTPLGAERFATLAQSGVVAAPIAERFGAWLAEHPPRGRRTPCVVHGDLYARHVLIDDAGRAAGIIDWGDLHLGDPALDLAVAHLLLPGSAHAAFRAAYGPIDAATWDAARYRAVYHAALSLDYGCRANDAGMRAAGEAALRLMDNAPSSCSSDSKESAR